jgi:hypothetical protein
MTIKSALLNRRLWSPAQLSSELWLDASDNSTINLTNDKVIEWRDKSGNSRHFLQNTDTIRPTVVGINGRQYVRFNGLNQQLISTAFPSSAVVCLFRKTVFNPSALFCTSNLETGMYVIIGTSGNIRIQHSNNTNVAFSFPHNLTSFNLVAANKNTSPMRVSGNNVNTDRTGSISIISPEASIGRALFSSAAFFGGEIAELIIFNRTISVTEFELLEGYLAFKWGLQSTLPSEHPYKNTCPFV